MAAFGGRADLRPVPSRWLLLTQNGLSLFVVATRFCPQTRSYNHLASAFFRPLSGLSLPPSETCLLTPGPCGPPATAWWQTLSAHALLFDTTDGGSYLFAIDLGNCAKRRTGELFGRGSSRTASTHLAEGFYMQMTTRFASALRAGVASGVLALSGAVAGGLMLSGAAMADDFVVGKRADGNDNPDPARCRRYAAD